MVSLEILESCGSTSQRLRELFTAVASDDYSKPKKGESVEEKKERIAKGKQVERDIEMRRRIDGRTQGRVYEGVNFSLKNWKKYDAVNLAWDSSAVTGATLPLLLYAQGKIDVGRCAKLLEGCKNGKDYIRTDAAGAAKSIDVVRFCETEFNLVRSVVNRRWAAQKNVFGKLWPYYEYEPRGTDAVAKLRADAWSQRVDIMADQFGYRRHDEQVILDGFLYAHSVDFIRCVWDREEQWRKKSVAGPATERETVITKEGVSWFNPQPARVFWDNNDPLPSINTDTGPKWIGYWDVARYSEIQDNPYYFNKDKVTWPGANTTGGFFTSFADYFTLNDVVIKLPPSLVQGGMQVGVENDRKANVGWYTSDDRDVSIFKTELFEEVVPLDMGVGTYPHKVWMRRVIASDYTTLYAEFLPSTPAAVLSINESDGRQVNVSMAMELLQYQQQMTNLLSQLINLLEIEAFKAIGINVDALEPEEAEAIKKHMQSPGWYDGTLVYKFSMEKLTARLGDDAKAAAVATGGIITIAQGKVSTSISVIFESMIKLVQMIERLFAMSPAELGQPAPREISATESTLINNTTSSIYSSISSAVNEFRAAKKRIIYESFASCAKAEVVLPVKSRYSKATVAAAGFTIVGDPNTDVGDRPKQYTVLGTPKNLQHDYIFTTRDGDDRPTDTAAANTLVQLMGMFLSSPAAQQKGAKSKLYAMMNEIFRKSGSGLDIVFDLEEGEEDSFGPSEIDQLKQMVEQLIQSTQQLAAQTQQNAQGLQQQQQVNAEQQQAIDLQAQMAEQVRKLAEQVQLLNQKQNNGEINGEQKAQLMTKMYDSGPDAVKAQIEATVGLVPADKRIYSGKASPPKPTAPSRK